MTSQSNAVAIALALLCASLGFCAEPAADTAYQLQEAPEAYAVRGDDTSKVLKRWDFQTDAGTLQGWKAEQDEQYKPWNMCQLVSDGFRRTKAALKTTVPNTWTTLGPFTEVSYTGDDTRVTVAYKTRKCTGLTAQGKVPALKKQLHGTAPVFVDGRWATHTFEVEKWTPWSGSETGRNQQFATLMVYASAAKGQPDPELLLGEVLIWQGNDTTPPNKVRRAGATLNIARGEVHVRWEAPQDNVFVSHFAVHRGITPEFEPSSKTLLGSTPEVDYHDSSINNFGTYYYKLVAEDAAGNVSAASGPIKVTVAE